jgi:hypothetical protein
MGAAKLLLFVSEDAWMLFVTDIDGKNGFPQLCWSICIAEAAIATEYIYNLNCLNIIRKEHF